MSKTIRAKWDYNKEERDNRNKLLQLFKDNPLPDNEILLNLNLFIKRQDLSQILFLNELYKKIINIHGVIMEFGVRWGKNLAQLTALRGIYEPFNHNRKIIGFDELNSKDYPGETISFDEIIGINKYKIQHTLYSPTQSFIVLE